MNTNWDLTAFYDSFESKELQTDLQKLDEIIEEYNSFKDKFDSKEETLVSFLQLSIAFSNMVRKLFGFASLTLATNTTHTDALNLVNKVSKKLTETTETSVESDKWIASFDIDSFKTDFMKEHLFYISEIKEQNRYNLDPAVEAIVSKINQDGVSAFERQQGLLTSSLDVDYKGEKITLSEVRNLAYDEDQNIRKAAYEAELAAYPQIEKSIALSLNSIKGYVNTMIELRGYDSPLGKALVDSRLQKETLDAMIEAIQDALPTFRKYLRRKGTMLGHPNGVPFYDLFAPIGENSRTFTIPEAQEYILDNFASFSPALENVAKRAFDENWIDYEPYKGKRGGAFCSNIPFLKQSRILSNFTGSFSDVLTLAHELGHAYHGDNIFSESVLNSRYTMPVAETASIMAETIVMNKAIKEAGKDSLTLLESSLQDATQVVVDILSRYLFEQSVFDTRNTAVLDEHKLNELMLDAQDKSYGDGLDPNYKHQYMWIPKGHYYSSRLSFYNFPYAFGLLFAKGLYAKYKEEGESFVPKFDELLRITGQNTVEDAAASVGITLDKAFWASSLKVIENDIETFLEITK